MKTATEKFEEKYLRPATGSALVVGSRVYPGRVDRRKLYRDVKGIDMLPGDGVDIVMNLEEEVPAEKFFHVDCMSVLEHSRRPWLLSANIEKLLAPGGTIFLTVPFVWRVHSYPSDYWRFTAAGVRELFPHIDWKLIEYTHLGSTPEGEKIQPERINGWRHFPRTEVCGVGVRQ